MYRCVVRKNTKKGLGAGALVAKLGPPVKTKQAATKRGEDVLSGALQVNGKRYTLPRNASIVVEKVPTRKKATKKAAPRRSNRATPGRRQIGTKRKASKTKAAAKPTATCMFGGKRYVKVSNHRTKLLADKKVKQLRAQGYSARAKKFGDTWATYRRGRASAK